MQVRSGLQVLPLYTGEARPFDSFEKQFLKLSSEKVGNKNSHRKWVLKVYCLISVSRTVEDECQN